MSQNQDTDQLRLLSIFQYIVGGMIGLFSLFPLIHLAIGIGILTGAFSESNSNEPPPEALGWFFVLFSSGFIISGLTLAICVAVAGQKLGRRTGHLYCLVIAGIECCFFPFGTVLGGFTIAVLTRPSVKLLFGIPAEQDANQVG